MRATTAIRRSLRKYLESGDVDIVGMGRGLIAEPNWVKQGAER